MKVTLYTALQENEKHTQSQLCIDVDFIFFVQVITKDSNVMVVALAGNVVTGIAKGLRKKFQPYASVIIAAMFEKFKEKKLNVVTSLREGVDAAYLSVSSHTHTHTHMHTLAHTLAKKQKNFSLLPKIYFTLTVL